MMQLALPSLIASALLVKSASAWLLPSAKNFIYIVPDGYGPASQTMARDYASLLQNGENPQAPVSIQLAADRLTIGNVRTQASDNLITDSAASATAFACGVKTYNGAIGVDDDGQPVGSILEAAKLQGLKTGLVVTSTINHATPACYAAHVADRNSYAKIAEHEIGYSHPLGPQVDILLGGGRCYFKPQSDPTSCRADSIDLLAYAQQQGYQVLQDRAAFDALANGTAPSASLPYIGLFNDDQLQYEIDRVRAPETEPSLLEMTTTALASLERATRDAATGFLLVVEASRIDHAGHANDAAAHLVDTLMYNDVLAYVRAWIDDHPDTLLLSAADHECGGLTLNGFDPLPLRGASMSGERAAALWRGFNGTQAERRAYLAGTLLPAYGLAGLAEGEIDAIARASNFAAELTQRLSRRAGVNWSTGGHTASDVTLFGYGAGSRGADLRSDMAGNWDNTELPKYIEGVLKLDMAEVTRRLREVGTEWVEKREGGRKREVDVHGH